MRFQIMLLSVIATALVPTVVISQQNEPDPKLTEVWEPVPRLVTPGIGNAPPSDAIVLFSGKDLSQWEQTDGTPPKWKVEDGAFTVVKGSGNLRTKRAFGDCQLHIEWRTPKKVEGESQERGNSGVFLQGHYEVQVLDSWDNRTFSNGQAASIYKQYIPLVNASLKPGEWQAYDIFYRAPHFDDDGTVTTPAYITVIHNGVLVQDHVEIKGTTVNSGVPAYKKHNQTEPLVLQDHSFPVGYRNIWIRPL
jgi:hypothetical protein